MSKVSDWMAAQVRERCEKYAVEPLRVDIGDGDYRYIFKVVDVLNLLDDREKLRAALEERNNCPDCGCVLYRVGDDGAECELCNVTEELRAMNFNFGSIHDEYKRTRRERNDARAEVKELHRAIKQYRDTMKDESFPEDWELWKVAGLSREEG